MFNKFISQNGLKIVNTVFEDYLGTQFFPSLKFANDEFDKDKVDDIYASISGNGNLINLYIHIPFCKTRCTYCHCYTSLELGDKYERYINYLIKEIIETTSVIGTKIRLDSIFIGGGTPNIVGENLLEKLFQVIDEKFDLTNIKQFNIDLNPYFLDSGIVDVLGKYGVNRCTYAIQSFDKDILKQNSRYYNEDINHKENIESLQKAGVLVNIDLMVGIKGQNLENCILDINYARELNADNISLNYFIQSSNVHYKIDEKNIILINKVKKYYNHYIYNTFNQDANFQEENYLSNKVDLIGFGNGSISHIYGKLICYNMGDNEDYYKDIDNGNSINKKVKYLDIKDQMIKFIWLNLIYKIDKSKSQSLFGLDIVAVFKDEFNYLEENNIIEINNNYIRPLVSNFKLYLYLSIFLRDYIVGVELTSDIVYLKQNMKKFFLPNGEKVDEDY